MSLYNLIEYNDNYSDTTASLYQFNRQEQPRGNDNALNSVSVDNSVSFNYKSGLLGDSTDVNAGDDPNNPLAHRLWKILKYISNFFRSLELPLINTKLYIELNWTNEYND